MLAFSGVDFIFISDFRLQRGCRVTFINSECVPLNLSLTKPSLSILDRPRAGVALVLLLSLVRDLPPYPARSTHFNTRRTRLTMPFNQLRRLDSFPPSIVHISPSTHHRASLPSLALQDLTNKPLPTVPDHKEEEDIDSNPISFFLTTPADSHDFGSDEDDVEFFSEHDDFNDIFSDDEDLSAGIEGSEEDLRKRDTEVREISPSSLQRQREEDAAAEADCGFAMPLSLKDFAARPVAPITINTTGRSSRTGHRASTGQLAVAGMGLPVSPPMQSHRDEMRGRGRVKLSPPTVSSGLRSVSWSPGVGSGRRKPVSWRVPSRDLWSINEADEAFNGLSSSAPTAGNRFKLNQVVGLGIGGLKRDADGRKKDVKKVRWADLEASNW